MGRLVEVALLLALFVFLHGARAQYDDYDYEDYDEADSYDYDEAEDVEEDFQEEGDASSEPDEVGEGGEPPRAGLQNQEFTPMCNNENCWIRVDWEPPPRDTWMSCILGYRVGFRMLDSGDDWHWMNAGGTHRDLRSEKLFFFEEAEGTNHSLTIRNLDFETNYEVIITVFNPYGTYGTADEVSTPPGSCTKVTLHLLLELTSHRAMPGRIFA